MIRRGFIWTRGGRFVAIFRNKEFLAIVTPETAQEILP